jgi:hypothetical protein
VRDKIDAVPDAPVVRAETVASATNDQTDVLS